MIRLEVHNPGRTGIRYWMDPNRGYLVMRVEYLELRDGKYAASTSADTLEVIQTPSGKWLPVLIRKNAGSKTLPIEILKSLPKGMIKDGRLRTDENYVRFFFQFETAISDDLFVIDDQ